VFEYLGQTYVAANWIDLSNAITSRMASTTACAEAVHSVSAVSVAEQDKILATMLQIFEEQVMKTHRCRYTQFVLFYLSCLRADFAETFLATMVRRGTRTLARQIRSVA